MQEVVTRDSPLTLTVFNLSSSNLFCYKSPCKWCSALHNPMVWPMLHIGCLIGLGSSSESSRLRTILWYICQQSDDRWVDTKGKTSSRLCGACSICFKRRKNLWAQFSMWKQISERCLASLIVLHCWGQTSVTVLWTLMPGHKSLFSLALWSCSIKIPPTVHAWTSCIAMQAFGNIRADGTHDPRRNTNGLRTPEPGVLLEAQLLDWRATAGSPTWRWVGTRSRAESCWEFRIQNPAIKNVCHV